MVECSYVIPPLIKSAYFLKKKELLEAGKCEQAKGLQRDRAAVLRDMIRGNLYFMLNRPNIHFTLPV
jgi:hypothetical protein